MAPCMLTARLFLVYLDAVPKVDYVLADCDQGLGVLGVQHVIFPLCIVYRPHFAILHHGLQHACEVMNQVSTQRTVLGWSAGGL